MTPSVALDSGIFIALMSRRDRWHAQAVALFDGPKVRWSTSVLIVAETYSWCLHRIGEGPARTFRSFLAAMSGLTIFDATVKHHQQVARMLERFRGAKLSYVDASSLCLIEQDRLRLVNRSSPWHHRHLGPASIMTALASGVPLDGT